MLNRVGTLVCTPWPWNSAFFVQNRMRWQSACYGFHALKRPCKESREGRLTLQRGRYCIATEASLQGETAAAGVQGGPYGKTIMSKTRVKKAEKASRHFWFEKKEMLNSTNNIDTNIFRPAIHRQRKTPCRHFLHICTVGKGRNINITRRYAFTW